MAAKLVVIGDSLTQGFQSGSISRISFSYPAMIARCLNDTSFNFADFQAEEGLPFNIEALLHLLAKRYGESINWAEFIPAFLTVQSYMDRVEDYWERGEGINPTTTGPLHRNLAVWGFQLSDAYTLSEQLCQAHIPRATDNPLKQIPEFAMYRTARRTLNPSFDPQYALLTQIDAAKEIGTEAGGIENLIFWLGSNNCLSTVGRLKIEESDDLELTRLAHERKATLWKPEHFQKILDIAAQKLAEVPAQNVFIANVPHVTIPPVSRGVSPGALPGQEQDSEGYYAYYTNFWIWDKDFSPARHPYLTRSQVRHIDEVIDQYNRMIADKAKANGWHLVDMCGLLDQFAFRRRQGKISYQFPLELTAALQANPKTKDRVVNGQPLLDTRYLRVDLQESDPIKKYRGGLFSLDGIHPTTIAYGVVAYEFLNVMKSVGVNVPNSLDWQEIVEHDTLITNPPANLGNLQDILGFLSSQTPLPELLQLMGGLNRGN
jgi:hypothetical protein